MLATRPMNSEIPFIKITMAECDCHTVQQCTQPWYEVQFLFHAYVHGLYAIFCLKTLQSMVMKQKDRLT